MPAPVLTSVDLAYGPVAGGQTVVIHGTGFFAPTGATFGGQAATGLSLSGSTLLTCVTPAHVAGLVNVTVTNAGPFTGTLVGGYTYAPAPTFVSVSPTSGLIFGGDDATITGTGFLSVSGVTFGGAAAYNVVQVSDTVITCSVPAHAAGAVDIVITNGDSQTATGAAAYTYNAATPVATGGGMMGIGMGMGVVPN